MNTILLIDDEPDIRKLLGRIIEMEGYEVLRAGDRLSGMDMLKKNEVQVILCDVFLPDGNGVDMVPELQAAAPHARIILLTAHGNIADGVQAIKNGAFDYIVKGDDNRKILPIVHRAMESVRGDAQKASPLSPSSLQAQRRALPTFRAVIGRSAAMGAAVRLAEKVAATDVPVLLTGETGTGKEVFAQAIHHAGDRRERPFVAVNCSAFSRELLESELFGHKAGAFTGATRDKMGLFEAADGGTLFLDEIGEMDTALQAKLLRVLESGEFMKVGEVKTTKVDVRILSATNRNLKDEIARGHFREDLFFRLSVFHISLPPLRERKEDIPLLAGEFARRFSQCLGRECPSIAPDCMELMQRYPWPGNVRELQNAIERALVICEGEVTCRDLPPDLLGESRMEGAAGAMDLAAVERSHIAKVLQYAKGNKSETARLLKIGLSTLYRKIEEYGLG